MKGLHLLVLLMVVSFASHAYEYDYGDVVKSKKFKTPKREFGLIVTQEGYYPDKISVYAGEEITLFLTSTLSNPSCLLIPEKNVHMAANMGKVTEARVVFSSPGEHTFVCPVGNIKGTITVIKKEDQLKRKMASIPTSQVWMPKEY